MKGSCPVALLSGDKGDWRGGCRRGRVHGLIHLIRSELDGQYSLLHSYPWKVLVFGALGLSSFGIRKIHKSPNSGAWRGTDSIGLAVGSLPT